MGEQPLFTIIMSYDQQYKDFQQTVIVLCCTTDRYEKNILNIILHILFVSAISHLISSKSYRNICRNKHKALDLCKFNFVESSPVIRLCSVEFFRKYSLENICDGVLFSKVEDLAISLKGLYSRCFPVIFAKCFNRGFLKNVSG